MSGNPDPQTMAELVGDPKEVAVERMFDQISAPYDRLNRLLSFGRDRAWRTRLARALQVRPGEVVCDLGCGTGDLSLAVAEAVSPQGRVLGVDLSLGMMRQGLPKRESVPETAIAFVRGNAARTPLGDRSVDGVSMGWVLRNVGDRSAVYAEVRRILKPGRRFAILDMSHPEGPIERAGFWGFRHVLMPVMARIAGGKVSAYRYLASSTDHFPTRKGIADELAAAGFEVLQTRALMMGAIALWVVQAPGAP